MVKRPQVISQRRKYWGDFCQLILSNFLVEILCYTKACDLPLCKEKHYFHVTAWFGVCYSA